MMPLSRRVARFNRAATNRLTLRIAGWLPGFAIVAHVGRRSGKVYQTPVNAFRTATGYRIALTYGAESDWVRNVLAADRCTLTVRGKRVALEHPRLVTEADRRWAPPVVRQILGLIGATQYLALTYAPGAGPARGGG
jgi:deazaflavin-dependent oxidoreductase (nitroreductase family)